MSQQEPRPRRQPGTKRAQPSALIGARLPRWAPYAAGVAAVVVALGLRWLLDWTGWGTAFWTAALLFVDRFHRLVVRGGRSPPGKGPVRVHPDLRHRSSPRSCRWC